LTSVIGTVLAGFYDGRASADGQVIFDGVDERSGHLLQMPCSVVSIITWPRCRLVHLHSGQAKATRSKHVVRNTQVDPIHGKINQADGLLEFGHI